MSTIRVTGRFKLAVMAISGVVMAVSAWRGAMLFTAAFGAVIVLLAVFLDFRSFQNQQLARSISDRLSSNQLSDVRVTVETEIGGVVAAAVLLVVLGGVLTLDRVWTRDGWPGVHQADGLPDPCKAVPQDRRDPLFPTPAEVTVTADNEVDTSDTQRRGCVFRSGGHSLAVSFTRYEDAQFTGGVGRAGKVFADTRSPTGGRSLTVTGAGDEAAAWTRTESTVHMVDVVVRRANVVVKVEFSGEAATATAGTVEAARAAAAAVKVD